MLVLRCFVRSGALCEGLLMVGSCVAFSDAVEGNSVSTWGVARLPSQNVKDVGASEGLPLHGDETGCV